MPNLAGVLVDMIWPDTKEKQAWAEDGELFEHLKIIIKNGESDSTVPVQSSTTKALNELLSLFRAVPPSLDYPTITNDTSKSLLKNRA